MSIPGWYRPIDFNADISHPEDYIPMLNDFSSILTRRKGQSDQEDESEYSEESEDDFELMESDILTGHFKKSSYKSKRGNRTYKYTEELSSLIGKANEAYLSGKFEKAANMLLQVIHKEPRVPEAYATLGIVYESLKEYDKSLKILVLGAYFDRKKEHEKWRNVYHKAKEYDNEDIAVYCLSRLIHFKSEKEAAYDERSKIFFKQGNLLRAYFDLKALYNMRSDDADVLLRYCRVLIARDNKSKAIQVLDEYFERLVDYFSTFHGEAEVEGPEWDDDVISLLCSLLLERGDLEEVSAIVQTLSRRLPLVELSLETRVICGIADFKQGNHSYAESMFSDLFQLDPNKYLDLWIRIIDAYLDEGNMERAMEIVVQIEESLKRESARLLHRKALCLKSSDVNEALILLERAVDMNPKSIEWTALLGEWYREQGDLEKALETLETQVSLTQEEIGTSGERSRKKYKRSKKEYPLNTTNVKICKLKADLSSQNGEFKQLLDDSLEILQQTLESLKEDVSIRKETLRNPPEIVHDIDFLDLVLIVCKALNYFEDHNSAISILEFILQFSVPDDPALKEAVASAFFQLRFLLIGVAFNKKDFSLSMRHFKQAIAQFSDILYDTESMNLFGKLLQKLGMTEKRKRYIYRLLKAHPDCTHLLLLAAHGCLLKRAFKLALIHYEKAFQVAPYQPVVVLFNGIASCLRATNMYVENRHEHVLRAFECMHIYEQMWTMEESSDQLVEACYNMAVVFQMLELNHFAVKYYTKVLCENTVLVHESAHNLSIIYRQSGAFDLARDVLLQYFQV